MSAWKRTICRSIIVPLSVLKRTSAIFPCPFPGEKRAKIVLNRNTVLDSYWYVPDDVLAGTCFRSISCFVPVSPLVLIGFCCISGLKFWFCGETFWQLYGNRLTEYLSGLKMNKNSSLIAIGNLVRSWLRPSDEERYVRVRVIGWGCKSSVLTMLHKVFLAFKLKSQQSLCKYGFCFHCDIRPT